MEPTKDRVNTTVSPRCWGLAPSDRRDSRYLDTMGLPKAQLELRARKNTYEWLLKQFNNDVGAFYGYYDPRTRAFAAPQTCNLIAPFQLIAAFDRYQDDHLLDLARRCSDWMNLNMVEDHPMSLVLGGVRDNIKREQLWTKYTADYIIANLALLERTANEEFLARAVRSGKFLLQSQNHRFAPKYNDFHETWLDTGWQSFGRAAESLMALGESTTNSDWIERAMAWVDYGIGLQAGDGCFYLINDSYYSSDIAADELRALMRTHWRTGRNRLLKAALHFADWHVEKQYPNGAWPLSIDRWGVTVTEYVGPGDVPNIAISLLLVHMETQDIKYLVSAVKALRYSIGQQAVPNDGGPYGDDPNTHWGYWSWDPRYDYTMSPDQSTHHVRGYWFFLDYFLSLSEETQKAVAEAAGPPDRGLPLLPEEWIASAA